ncbi:alpha/beta hydrolase [Methylophaga sp.]|uniref:alpha/beta hydrolase n=1 Tax=Methylophaga sp. TaxID=2024840 RepID=UPI003F699694
MSRVRCAKRAICSAFFVWLTSACSPVTVLNAVIPENGFKQVSDIAYGNHTRQQLDVFLPSQLPEQESVKTIIFFYGGSWESGHKEDYKFVAEALTSAGFIVVIPDYRVYPDVKFPDFVQDAAKSVNWVKNNIHAYGGNASQIFVAGHSAGAHLASLLVLDEQYLASYALSPQDLRGMIGLAGPYDFLPLKSKTLKTIFGPEQERWRSQPINFVKGDNPPMLILVGTDDLTVWPKNSLNLAAKIREKGGNVKLVELDGYGHVAMVAKLAKPLRGDGRLLNEIVSFTRQY